MRGLFLKHSAFASGSSILCALVCLITERPAFVLAACVLALAGDILWFMAISKPDDRARQARNDR
jgi:hypothetical protein